MAFIREYAAQDMGDPFSLRIPKRLRKLKVGRALGRLGKIGLSLVPGVGGTVGQLLSATSTGSRALNALRDYGAAHGLDDDTMSAFARSYGFDMGDPGPPKPSQKRKTAGAGPKAKAKKKADKRHERAARVAPKKAAKGKHKGIDGSDTSASDARAAAMLKALKSGNVLGAAVGEAASIFGGKGAKGLAGGGGHRRLNPANVKALNRSLRRVEGFEKLAARVHRSPLYRRVRGAATRGAHRAAARGHKAGCRCAVCSR